MTLLSLKIVINLLVRKFQFISQPFQKTKNLPILQNSNPHINSNPIQNSDNFKFPLYQQYQFNSQSINQQTNLAKSSNSLITNITMANFATKLLADFRTFVDPKVIKIALHSVMLLLCLIGSIVFVCDFIETQAPVIANEGLFNYWSIEMLSFWMSSLFSFVKVKVIIPTLIVAYFYYCVKSQIFQKLLKADYSQKYVEKYSTIHDFDVKKAKHTPNQLNILDQSTISQASQSQSRRNPQSKQDQSLNISKDMVKSMNRSMLESMRSMGGSNMSQSMIDRGNLSMRSSKIIQNLSRKIVQNSNAKDLSALFEKGNKNLSESFMSGSSSNIEGDEARVRIKNRKYYDFISMSFYYKKIDDSQGQEFKKWYDEASARFLQQLKVDKYEPRGYHADLMQLKRGLEKELSSFLKEYKENTEAIKECLVRFWGVKIQAFESKKPFKTAYELSSLFKEKENVNTLNLTRRENPKDLVLSEKVLFTKCSSPRDFLKSLNKLKINLRNPKEKDFAEKELLSILSRKSYLNTLLNLTTIEGELFSELEVQKLKTVEKALNALSLNKLDIFTLSRNDHEVTEMDLLQEYDIQTIKEMIELRMSMLTFIVNKINLMSGERQFKVKMKLAVTYDSGFLNTTINFFHNRHFAQILCDKSFDNVFSHFNLKVFRSVQPQQAPKESVISCKPGIDNSISVMLALVREISDYLNRNQRLDERQSFEEKRREETFKQFIESLHVSRL